MSFEICRLKEIYQGLYLGNAEVAWDLKAIQKLNITAILNVTKDQKLPKKNGSQVNLPDNETFEQAISRIQHYKQIPIEGKDIYIGNKKQQKEGKRLFITNVFCESCFFYFLPFF